VVLADPLPVAHSVLQQLLLQVFEAVPRAERQPRARRLRANASHGLALARIVQAQDLEPMCQPARATLFAQRAAQTERGAHRANPTRR